MEDPEKKMSQEEAALNWEQYSQFQTAFADILGMMREIPVHASEVPPENDRHVLTKVELPEAGGVLAFMDHFEHPYKGFPYGEFVAQVDSMKKLIKGTMSGLYHSPFRWKLIFAVPALKELLFAGVYTFHRLVYRYIVKPHRYSDAVRELHRAFSAPLIEDHRAMELRYMARDIVCMVLEFDNAYRYRAQDLLVEIDMEALSKRPIRELRRVCKIASARELTQQVKDTWKLIGIFITYLWFDGKLKNSIVHVLSSLDKEKFGLTPADIEFARPRKDYVFGFKS